MPGRTLAAATAAALILATASSAHAVELGIQDDGRISSNPQAVLSDGHDLGATWVRLIVAVGSPTAAARIRIAHANGYRVLLTLGGTGTRTRKPTAKALLAYLHRLPVADRYTVINEPDLSGIRPCRYLNVWRAARRLLGHRLLFGDFSPHAPLTYTQQAAQCGHKLPRTLEFALHPYQTNDPLTAGADEGSLGSLAYARRWLRTQVGVNVHWWLTEFGYPAEGSEQSAPTGAQAAWMWPRAILQARRARARVLIAYTAQGPTWDTHLDGTPAWCVLTRRCSTVAAQTATPARAFTPGY